MRQVLFMLTVSTLLASPTHAQTTYSGSGDDVVAIDMPEGEDIPHFADLRGNSEGRHFSVVARTPDRTRVGALVNTTEPYEGRVALNTTEGTEVGFLEITATGSWEIEVLSFVHARQVDLPGSIDGSGDDVVILRGEPSTARIEGNREGRHFSVVPYEGSRGARLGGVVNATEPYNGTVLLPAETRVLEISAFGAWQIEIDGEGPGSDSVEPGEWETLTSLGADSPLIALTGSYEAPEDQLVLICEEGDGPKVALIFQEWESSPTIAVRDALDGGEPQSGTWVTTQGGAVAEGGARQRILEAVSSGTELEVEVRTGAQDITRTFGLTGAPEATERLECF